MDTFKQELKTLLSRYPQVKNVRYTIEESVSVQEPSLMMPSMQIPVTGVAMNTEKPPTPFENAMTVAEQTINAITKGTSGKMTVTQS